MGDLTFVPCPGGGDRAPGDRVFYHLSLLQGDCEDGAPGLPGQPGAPGEPVSVGQGFRVRWAWFQPPPSAVSLCLHPYVCA